MVLRIFATIGAFAVSAIVGSTVAPYFEDGGEDPIAFVLLMAALGLIWTKWGKARGPYSLAAVAPGWFGRAAARAAQEDERSSTGRPDATTAFVVIGGYVAAWIAAYCAATFAFGHFFDREPPLLAALTGFLIVLAIVDLVRGLRSGEGLRDPALATPAGAMRVALRIAASVAMSFAALIAANIGVAHFYGEPHPALAGLIAIFLALALTSLILIVTKPEPVRPLYSSIATIALALAAMPVAKVVLEPYGVGDAESIALLVMIVTLPSWGDEAKDPPLGSRPS